MPLPTLQLTSPRDHYDARRCWLGTRSYWLCQLIGWGGVCVLMIGPMPFRMRVSSAEVAAIATFFGIGLVLTHGLRIALIPLLRDATACGRLLVRAVPAIVVLSSLHALLQVGFARTVLPHDAVFLTSRLTTDPLTYAFLDTFTLSVSLFVFWAGAYVGIHIYRCYQDSRIERLELDARMQEAAWQALRAQLNPHLLFNSLNSIRALIPRENRAPREAITHLSELLRTTLSLKNDQLITVRQELDTVDSFLALERLRFEQRLRDTREIDPAALAWQVPPFLVQILVENAVKYGVAPYEDGGAVVLRIAVRGERLVIEVENRGQLGSHHPNTSTGLGLRNVRSRLALLFGDNAQVTVENIAADRVRARALVPRVRIATENAPAFSS